MSYDVKTDKMDWKDEYSWIAISIVSGIILSFLFFYFDQFPDANPIITIVLSCFGFYLLSILLRIQNQRGRILTGTSGSEERKLKYIFPVIGFAVGLALLFLG